MTGKGSIALDQGVNLPDNYTIEFDVVPHPSGKDLRISISVFTFTALQTLKILMKEELFPGKRE